MRQFCKHTCRARITDPWIIIQETRAWPTCNIYLIIDVMLYIITGIWLASYISLTVSFKAGFTFDIYNTVHIMIVSWTRKIIRLNDSTSINQDAKLPTCNVKFRPWLSTNVHEYKYTHGRERKKNIVRSLVRDLRHAKKKRKKERKE